jgi:phosphoserine phosphatase RsbU/P
VSGDYYDYVRLDERWTAVALGDVSGKGVSAALLMASLQSSLHAQLTFSRHSWCGHERISAVSRSPALSSLRPEANRLVHWQRS